MAPYLQWAKQMRSGPALLKNLYNGPLFAASIKQIGPWGCAGASTMAPYLQRAKNTSAPVPSLSLTLNEWEP